MHPSIETVLEMPNTTHPAPAFESAAFIPPAARLSDLAKLALEAGVSADNVRAYLTARYAVKPMSVEVLGAA
jgi:hypothetical protein